MILGDHYFFWGEDSGAFFDATKNLSDNGSFEKFQRIEDPIKGHGIFIVPGSSVDTREKTDPASIFTDVLRANPELKIKAQVSSEEENHSILSIYSLYLTSDDDEYLPETVSLAIQDVQPNYQWDFDNELQELKRKFGSRYAEFDNFAIDGDSDCNIFVSNEFSKEKITIEIESENYIMKATKNGYIIEDITIIPKNSKQNKNN